MNKSQLDVIGSWLSSLSVGVLLVGVLGQHLVQTNLRYAL
jgi:hypothetical protein